MDAGATLDPVCGRAVDPLRARAVGIFGGTTYYFCSADCKSRYADPRATAREPELPPRAPAKSVVPTAVISVPPPKRIEAQPAPVAVAPEPTEISLAPKRSSRTPLLIGVVLAAAGAAIWGGARRAPTVTPPLPAPVATAPVVAAPVRSAPPKPAVPAPPDVAVDALTSPLKVGLRRFVARTDDKATLSWQLLLIDASGHATPFVVTELPASDEEAKGVTEEAVAPEDEFLSARRDAGLMFQDTLHAAAKRIDVRVTRAADMLSVETRESAESGDAEAAPWQRRIHLPLAESDLLRGAPFARKRYSE